MAASDEVILTPAETPVDGATPTPQSPTAQTSTEESSTIATETAAGEPTSKEASTKTSKKSKKQEEDNSDSDSSDSDSGSDSDSDEDEETAKADPGSISEAKNLYKSAEDSDGNWTWTSKYPEDVHEAAENKKTAKFAVIVRNTKSQDSRKTLEAESIVIQSPWLRTALGEILVDYPGVATELQRLEFSKPFKPFVHRWDEFLAYRKRKDLDEKTVEHLNLLYKILKYEIGEDVKAFEDYIRNGVITFKHLWMIFQPGGTVLAAYKGPLSAFEVEDSEYIQTKCGNMLEMQCACVDYDGTSFGRYTEEIRIPDFLGVKKITTLRAFPFSFAENRDAIRDALVRRGQIFESLAGHHFKSYSGKAITWNQHNDEVPIQVTGRIVVDIKSFNRFSQYSERWLSDWNAKDLELLKPYNTDKGRDNQEGTDSKDTLGDAGDEFDEEKVHVALSPYHHMIARSRTRGYSLKLKKWLDFFVDQVGEISWNTDAYDKLVLDEDQKELIMSFSESQLEGSSFDDVIAGKGQGVICLLSGPPGVGKTLTAEAVAEHLKVPLHTLTSGDLGSTAYELEQGLSRILELVARWKAIVLIDECDVFLEARSPSDLDRNEVVSVFLRTLEYYEGIMFMTTNRVDNIDMAFQSRIHVSLEYPDLTADSRRAIWANFLSASGAATELTHKDVDELARLELNGRQIKNVLKMAQLLAGKKKTVLQRSYIDTVLALDRRRPEMKKLQ